MVLSSAERPALSPPLLYDSYGPRVWVQGDILVYGLRLRSKFFFIFQTFPQMSQYYLLTSPSIPYRLKCHLYHVLNSQMCLGSICEHTICQLMHQSQSLNYCVALQHFWYVVRPAHSFFFTVLLFLDVYFCVCFRISLIILPPHCPAPTLFVFLLGLC